jgi:hypothetical protein
MNGSSLRWRTKAVRVGQFPKTKHQCFQTLEDKVRNERSAAIGRKVFLFVGSERAGHAARIYYSSVESRNGSKGNSLASVTYVLSNARNRAVVPPTPNEFATLGTARVGECAV